MKERVRVKSKLKEITMRLQKAAITAGRKQPELYSARGVCKNTWKKVSESTCNYVVFSATWKIVGDCKKMYSVKKRQ